MKPQFALDLSNTGIRLMHMAGADEVELGFVSMDDPEFDTRVHDLYLAAEQRSKGRVRSLLLLPNSEVLYTRVPTGRGDREARAKAVAEALQKMTPYTLDELQFDWRADGEEAVVAAVARQTLQEAESFATARGFNPLGFSARPDNGAFKGTPNFGATQLAEARKSGAPWPDPPQRPEPPEPASAPAAEVATDDEDHAVAELPAAPFPDAETLLAEVPAPMSEPQDTPDSAAIEDTADAAQDTVTDQAPAQMEDAPDSPTAGADDAPGAAEPPAPEKPEASLSKPPAAAASSAPAASLLPEAPVPAAPKPKANVSEAAMPEADELPEVPEAPMAEDVPAIEPEQPTGSQPDIDTDAATRHPTPDAAGLPVDLPAMPPLDSGASATLPDAVPDKAEIAPDSQNSGSAAAPDDKAQQTPRKRGAGRAIGPTERKAKGKTKATGAAPTSTAPAFSSRRHPPDLTAPKVYDPASPPPRPAGLPPVGAPLPDTPPPPRPKIPPHLAKPVSGPNALPAGKTAPAASGKTAKPSRLSQLMARLQSTPDGGAPATGSDTAALAPIPDLPKPAAQKAPPPPPARKSAKPSADAPKPRESGATVKAGGLPDPDDALASLTPGHKSDSAPLPPPRNRNLGREGLNEAQAMTLFGARDGGRERSMAPVLIGIAVVLALAVAVWAGVFVLGRETVAPTATESGALGLSQQAADNMAVDSDVGPVPAPEPTQVSDAEPMPEPAPVIEAATQPDAAPDLEATAAPDAAQPESVEVAALPTAESELPAPADIAPAPPLAEVAGLAVPGDPVGAPTLGSADLGPQAASPSVVTAPAPDVPPGPQETAQPLPEPATREAAVSRYAALGIWQIPPDPPTLPEAGRIDNLRLASLAGSTSFGNVPDLSSVPETTSPLPPPAVLPPAPPGTDFDLTDDGLVVATPDGALSPEGVLVTTGAPAAVPPTRPGRPASLRDVVPVNPGNLPDLRPLRRPGSDIAGQEDTALTPVPLPSAAAPRAAIASLVPDSAPATTNDTAPVPAVSPATPEVEVTVLTAQDTALRPRSRPLQAPVASNGSVNVAEATDSTRPAARPEVATRAEASLAASRGSAAASALASTADVPRTPSPPARPARFASLMAVAAAPGAASASLADRDSPTEDEIAEGNSELPDSPYAVIRSMKPEARPTALEKKVARARTQTGPPVVAAAAVKPTAPTPQSVGRSATETNALHLARLNLIGVYGGNADRRALIRLPSGRFVKVEVGDRLDGGRVASIGDNELRYTKGGRNITLRIPG